MIETPAVLEAILRDSANLGFTMTSESVTGSLLRVLAATKPGGRLLELGTGTGVGTCWLLAGMDEDSRLESVDVDPEAQEVARRHLGDDRRVTFRLEDGVDFLERSHPHGFDLIFADAWPGKFARLDLALAHLRPGGIYVVDDLRPQGNWPEGHQDRVEAFIADLVARPGFVFIRLTDGPGLMIVAKTS